MPLGEAEKLYKVLLVDDEEEVRQAIARKLNWEQLGFVVVGEAGNGEDALELAERLEPDVIMTDIKMPFMDGLTLCRKAKELLPGVKVAIFSGFDEFEYAKEAISLEVEEYILKPIDAVELASVFTRIKELLDKEIAESRDLERLRSFYQESLPLMHQQLLFGLLSGRFDSQTLAAQLEGYRLDIKAEYYCVASVEFTHLVGARDTLSQEERLASFSLPQLIAETIKTPYDYRFIRQPDSIELLFLSVDRIHPRGLMPELNRLISAARKRLGIRLAIGLGSRVKGLEEVPLSYRQAREALGYRVLVEDGQSVYINDIVPGTSQPEIWDTQLIDGVLQQIKVGSKADLEKAVQRLFYCLKGAGPSLQQCQLFMLSVSADLFRLVKSYHLDEQDEALSAALLEKSSFRFVSLEEMAAWLQEYCEKLRQMLRTERKDATRFIVDKAIAYLQEHYSQSDLSVEVLSNEICVSPAYFSTVFKKETGQAFVAYLTGLRIEKALEYLNTTDYKTYMIAEKIGYTDPNYFSYVFKKQVGISPSKYRSDRVTGHESV